MYPGLFFLGVTPQAPASLRSIWCIEFEKLPIENNMTLVQVGAWVVKKDECVIQSRDGDQGNLMQGVYMNR